MLLHGVAHDLSEEGTRLREIAIGMIWLVSGYKTCHSVGRVAGFFVEGEAVASVVEGVGFVVGS